MRKLNIRRSIIVNTSALKTWGIVGQNFLNISDWGRGIQKSWEDKNAAKDFNDAPAGTVKWLVLARLTRKSCIIMQKNMPSSGQQKLKKCRALFRN